MTTPVMLIGGPRHGEILTIDRKRLNGVLVMPRPVEPADMSHATAVFKNIDMYFEQKLYTPDGWVQLTYVHSDLSRYLDTISETTMIAAILGPWREYHRQLANGER